MNSAYLLTFATLLLVTGRLGDRFGPRPVFILGLVIFTLASLGCGLSGTIGLLITARAVQGIGAALMTPQTMSMITRVFPPQKRGAALGIWGAVAGVATIAGPVLGGILVQTAGWEWIFYINIPVAVVALGFAITRLPKLPDRQPVLRRRRRAPVRQRHVPARLRHPGGRHLRLGDHPRPDHRLGCHRRRRRRAHGVHPVAATPQGDALLPLSLFKSRNFSLANVAGASVTFGLTGIFFPLTLFLQEVLGLEPLNAALVGLLGSLLSGVVAPFAGRLSDRIAAKWVVATGFLLVSISVFLLAVAISPDVPIWHLVAAMALFGVGTGALFSPLASLATSGLDQRTAGAGAGAFNTTRQIGGVIGSAVIVALLTSRLAVTIPAAARDQAATCRRSSGRASSTGSPTRVAPSRTGRRVASSCPTRSPRTSPRRSTRRRPRPCTPASPRRRRRRSCSPSSSCSSGSSPPSP